MIFIERCREEAGQHGHRHLASQRAKGHAAGNRCGQGLAAGGSETRPADSWSSQGRLAPTLDQSRAAMLRETKMTTQLSCSLYWNLFSGAAGGKSTPGRACRTQYHRPWGTPRIGPTSWLIGMDWGLTPLGMRCDCSVALQPGGKSHPSF